MDNSTNAPESVEIQAIEVSDSLGSYTITLPSLAKCLWHGPYQTGKLSVYRGDVSGKTSIPILALVYVWTDSAQPELDSVGYVCYDANVELNAAVSHLLTTLDEHYIARSMRQKEEGISDGTHTLQ